MTVPVEYRDSASERVLGRRYEAEVPAIGRRVMLGGVWEGEGLYGWRCHPCWGVVCVRPVAREARSGRRVPLAA